MIVSKPTETAIRGVQKILVSGTLGGNSGIDDTSSVVVPLPSLRTHGLASESSEGEEGA